MATGRRWPARPPSWSRSRITRPGATSGSRTTNSLPLPSPSLWASTVPPCISTRFFTSVRPMPSPPCDRVAAWSTCTNRSKTAGQHVGGDPDAGVPHPQAPPRRRPVPAVSQMRPPGSVYLAALVSRLPTTWASRTGSASRGSDSAGRRHVKSWPWASMSGWTVSTARATTAASSTRSLRSSILPRMIRETSSRSSTSRTRCCTCRSIIVPGPLRRSPHRPAASSGFAARCGSGPAGCGVRGPASPGTRPCGGRPPAAPPRSASGR